MWQPDSVYANLNVKRIFVYLNSPKGLSEIVDFDKTGKRVYSTKYSACYNRRSRDRKSIQEIKLYNYDSLSQLISIADSVGADSVYLVKTCKVFSGRYTVKFFQDHTIQ